MKMKFMILASALFMLAACAKDDRLDLSCVEKRSHVYTDGVSRTEFSYDPGGSVYIVSGSAPLESVREAIELKAIVKEDKLIIGDLLFVDSRMFERDHWAGDGFDCKVMSRSGGVVQAGCVNASLESKFTFEFTRGQGITAIKAAGPTERLIGKVGLGAPCRQSLGG